MVSERQMVNEAMGQQLPPQQQENRREQIVNQMAQAVIQMSGGDPNAIQKILQEVGQMCIQLLKQSAAKGGGLA